MDVQDINLCNNTRLFATINIH